MTTPFIIAEAGSNWRSGTHARDLAMGKSLIEAAKEADASAVKFQVYRARTVYVQNAGGFESHCGSDLEDITKVFQDLEMPYELVGEFAKYAKECGIEFMATPFSVPDFTAIDPFVSHHKMASYEMQHVRLWEPLIASRKPVFFSTGGFTLTDIDELVGWLADAGAPLSTYTVMHCVAAYPAALDSLGLDVISKMKQRYAGRGLRVGYSDHSLDPVVAPAAAVALGATAIEKHFTLNRRLPGPDHPFAIEPDELKKMVIACNETYESVIEKANKGESEAEAKLRLFAHRGLQALRRVEAGEVLVEGENFGILRPGNRKKGASPLRVEAFAGRRLNVQVEAGDGLTEDMLA